MKRGFTYIFGTIISIITLLCILSPDISIVNQMSEYTVHIMFFTLFLGLIFLILDKPNLLFISFLCTGSLAIFLKSASNNELKYPEQDIASSISISHFNLSNTQYDLADVIHTIEQNDPDIVTFEEYTPEWTNILFEKISPNYKYSYSEVRIDPFGMAIYSKNPLVDPIIKKYQQIPNMQFKVELNDDYIQIFLSYILPPVLDRQNQTTKDHLKFIGENMQLEKLPTIVLGDFNMVYWKKEILTFRANFNLQNSRKESTSFGLTVPYDHMFYTQDLACTTLQDLTNTDGVHIGIHGEFQYTRKKMPTSKAFGYLEK